jgi:hypothetical protein
MPGTEVVKLRLLCLSFLALLLQRMLVDSPLQLFGQLTFSMCWSQVRDVLTGFGPICYGHNFHSY